MLESTPLIPLAALAAVVAAAALVVRRDLARGRRPRPADLAWLAPAVVALVACAAVVGLGLFEREGDGLTLVALSLAALLEAACALLRRPLLDALERLGGRGGRWRAAAELLRAGIAAGALALSCALGWLALELPWNGHILDMEPLYPSLEVAMILGALVLLYFLFQRRGAGMAVGVGALSLVGIAQFFVARFKDAAIMPNDLLALGTAAEVSGGYVYSVDHLVLLGVSCALVAMAACALVAPSRCATREQLGVNALGNVIAALAAASCLWGLVTTDLGEAFGLQVSYWDSLQSYEGHGFLPSFVRVAQDLPIDRPEGYDERDAADLERAYADEYDDGRGSTLPRAAAEAQFERELPSIVCVMDETFSDLSIYDGLGVGYQGPEFYRSLVSDAGTLSQGSLAVSVLGGGTCNTEFEFLTGVSLAYVGNGKYPFMLYDMSEAPSLPAQLAELGYATTAIHPNSPTNWNRQSVYDALGFDEFLSFEDFKTGTGDEEFAGVDFYHGAISDGATFDKVLELLRSSDEPQFIFDVTMQNHSGYLQSNVPLEDLPGYEPEGLDAETTAELGEYLACITASDRDLAAFVEELRQLDRPVILLYFGDHQPGFSPELADALMPDASEQDKLRLIYSTTYTIWANYDVAGSAVGGVETDSAGPAQLAAMLLDAAGAPLTDYQKAQMVAREDVPAASLIGTELATGAWIALDDDGEGDDIRLPQAYADMRTISYLEFGSKQE